MRRHRIKLPADKHVQLKNRLLRTCGSASHALFLDSNEHFDKYSRFQWLAGIEAHDRLEVSENSLTRLQNFRLKHKDWMLGHLSFEIKNELELLESRHPDLLGFPHLHFFVPKYLVYHDGHDIWLETRSPIEVEDFLKILEPLYRENDIPDQKIKLPCLSSREQYLNTVSRLRQELQYGNIYEINYCIEFATFEKLHDPTAAFLELNLHTEAPFAAYYKMDQRYLLCASPERYLQKRGRNVISQPMKGTARRDTDPGLDAKLKQGLAEDEKECSENVMITDLVRNDLSKMAKKGSVKVDELFGVYSYKNVHQMLSTVSCQTSEEVEPEDLLKASFPMGSMTGAPKLSALGLIDQHESFCRGLYSGSVGYITPEGDFDLNVVIRSLLYNDETHYLSARVGSAITIHCNAVKEYEECLLKAESLLKALQKEHMSAS